MTKQTINHSDRAHALLSASSAARWLVCPPSAVAAELYPKQDTDFTREGTLAHEVAEIMARRLVPQLYQDTGTAEFPEGHTQEMIDCAEGYAEYILEQIRSEDAVVLLEQRVDFSPWVPGGFGTADCIIIQGTTMDVIDYKYGKGVAVSAQDNPQMLLYGLGAINDFGYAYDVESVRLHIYQPRLNNVDLCEKLVPAILDWGDLKVLPTAVTAAEGGGDYNPSEHCRFCPHAGRCPALTKVCTEYVNSHGVGAGVPVLAPWEVAEVLRMESLVSLWLKRVKDQAMTTLMNGGDVPGFKVVAGRGTRAWTDELAAAEKLKAAGYGLEDITKTELLSVAAMEKAIGKKKAAEILADLIETKTGAPTVVPESDKRPRYDRKAEALKDFEEA